MSNPHQFIPAWRKAIRRATPMRDLLVTARIWHDVWHDRRLGVATEQRTGAGFYGHSFHKDWNGYQGLPYVVLERYLAPLKLQPDDVVFDIGCGLGRIVFAAARHRVRKCVGVDVTPELVQGARLNAQRLRGRRAEIEIQLADARFADYTEGTVFILFNPFGAETTAEVLDKLRESVQQHPRPIRIGYFLPVQQRIFDECGWLERYAETRSVWTSSRAIYWRSKA